MMAGGMSRRVIRNSVTAQFWTVARLAAEVCKFLFRIFPIRESDHIVLRSHDPIPAGVPMEIAVFRADPSGIAAGGGTPRFALLTSSAGSNRGADSDALSGMKGSRAFSRADNPPDDLLHITPLSVLRIRAQPGLQHFDLNVCVSHGFCRIVRRGKYRAGRGRVSRRTEHQRGESRTDDTGNYQQMFLHVYSPFLKIRTFG